MSIQVAQNISTSHVPTRTEQITLFEQNLPSSLRAYINEMKESNPDWRVSDYKVISLTNRPNALLSLYNVHNKKIISIRLPSLPQDLTAEERYNLRRLVNKTCIQFGFVPNKTRQKPLSSATIRSVREGDAQALSIWVDRHYQKWLKYAENAILKLKRQDLHTLLKPEDFVSVAYQRTIMHFKQYPEDLRNPDNVFGMKLMEIYKRAKYSNMMETSLRVQSDSQLVTDFSRNKWHEFTMPASSALITQELIDRLIKTAMPKLSPRQQELLNVIMAHHRQQSGNSYYLLSFREIASMMSPNSKGEPLSTERIGQYVEGRKYLSSEKSILSILVKTAIKMSDSDPEMSELATHLFYLMSHDKKSDRGRNI